MEWRNSGRRGAAAAVVVALLLALPPATARAAVHDVAAAGNAITGGLAFEPADTTAALGDTVRWTNTDFFAPHTATEVHGLFDLSGDYGQTPLNPAGFGPGETRERVFEAGAFDYYCVVHPEQMRGTVTVAPEVRRARVHGRRGVRVTWAPAAPDGHVFDVQRRSGGRWRTVLQGTVRTHAKFRGTRNAYRARLRSASDPEAASRYSPAVRP